ncbi:MAG TPA: hypothetical protein VGM03_21780 [Phycisphaerae bacterium]
MPPPTDPPAAAGHATPLPTPRAFVSATGLLFQVVGVIYVLGGCCLWSLAGQLIDRPAEVRSWWSTQGAGENVLVAGGRDVRPLWAQRAGAAAVVGTFLGGLALTAFGIGMQGEKQRSAIWGTLAAGALALLWLACAAAWMLLASAWLRAGLAVLLSAVNTLLMLLAAYSARTLRLHPPPPDTGIVSPEFVQQFERRDHE